MDWHGEQPILVYKISMFACHYGSIFPIDIFNGINIRLIETLVIHAKIIHWGSLENPFYKISKRLIKVWMVYIITKQRWILYCSNRKFFSTKLEYFQEE